MTGRPANGLAAKSRLNTVHGRVYNWLPIGKQGVRQVDFISVRQLRTQSADVWQALAESKDLVVTSNGKPIAILSATTAKTLEASLAALRQARAQLAVAAMQRRARATGAERMTLDDINAEIGAVRGERLQ